MRNYVNRQIKTLSEGVFSTASCTLHMATGRKGSLLVFHAGSMEKTQFSSLKP